MNYFDISLWAVVVAQLVEWTLLMPVVLSSNPVINKFIMKICLPIVNCIAMTKIKKKRPGMAHLKIHFLSTVFVPPQPKINFHFNLILMKETL